MIALDIAHDDADLLVVTENGYGKRTRVSDYPVKGRGGLGVKTVQLTEARGKLAGARVVRDGYQVMLISTGGTVIRMPVEEIKRLGRSTQGVIVMRLRGTTRRSRASRRRGRGATSTRPPRRVGAGRAARGADFDDGLPAAPDDADDDSGRILTFSRGPLPKPGKSVYMFLLRGRRIRR